MNRFSFSAISLGLGCFSAFFLVFFFHYKYLTAVFSICLILSLSLLVYLNAEDLKDENFGSFFPVSWVIPAIDSKKRIGFFSVFFLSAILSIFYLFNLFEQRDYITNVSRYDISYMLKSVSLKIRDLNELRQDVSAVLKKNNYVFFGVEEYLDIPEIYNVRFVNDETNRILRPERQLNLDIKNFQAALNENEKVSLISIKNDKILLNIISSDISDSGVYQYLNVVFDITPIVSNLKELFGYEFIFVSYEGSEIRHEEIYSTGFRDITKKIFQNAEKDDSELLFFKLEGRKYLVARANFHSDLFRVFSRGYFVKEIDGSYPGGKYFIIEVFLGTLVCMIIIMFLYTYTDRMNKTVSDIISEKDEYYNLSLEKDRNLRASLDAIEDGVIITDISGFITAANISAQMLTGFSFEYEGSRNIRDIFNFRAAVSYPYVGDSDDILESIVKTKKIIFECSPSDFTMRDIQITLKASVITSDFNESIGVVFVIKNMFNENSVEPDVSKMICEAIDITDTGVWELSPVSGKIVYSDSWKNFLGFYEKKNVSSLDEFLSVIHPNERHSAREAIKLHVEGKTNYYISEHRLMRKDGTFVWVCDKGQVIERNENGDAARMVGITYEISRHKSEERFLSEMKYFFNRGPVAYVIWKNDNDLPVECASSNIEELTGYSDTEFLSGSVFYKDIMDIKDYSAVMEDFKDLENSDLSSADRVVSIYTNGGEKKDFRHHVKKILDDKGSISHFIGYIIEA
ncbi:MAG: PAS domain-containing protein [Desulfobacteraceae bacterium]|nr:PAS domain-containing protein [Desulfobacteraceae bacterium]MCB9494259.1 PAS domain-containing protein [Desulfobacteraceae bacterium]